MLQLLVANDMIHVVCALMALTIVWNEHIFNIHVNCLAEFKVKNVRDLFLTVLSQSDLTLNTVRYIELAVNSYGSW